MKAFGWIIFILSLICSFMTIIDLISGVKYVGWDWLLVLIPFSLSICGFGYLFRKTLLKGNNIIKLILIILAILFAVYVWPTPYRNMPPLERYGSHIPFRIHRITGKGELWYNKGWTVIK
jgi:hypothetical protein